MESGTSVSAAAEQLLAAAKEYKSGVSSLLNALERDVYSAAERCWRLQDRPVQLRGGLIRSKHVVLQEATFMPEVEQHELGGALDQWRDAVKSVAAAAALQVGVAEQHLLAAVGRVTGQQNPAASAEQLLGLLGTLLSTHDALLALNQRDLRRTVGLLGQLAVQVAAAWRRSGSGSPHDLLASHSAAPEEVIAVLTAPAEATAGAGGPEAATPGLLPEQAASVAALLERQRATLEELSDAADVLRFWGRRSEKAAAGSAATEGREGDVPPMLTQAQQVLWAASQAYDEEQVAADLRTRQLVCQRYKPADLPALQARADEFASGERVPAQQNLMFEPEFVELRGQARAVAARFVQEEGIARAAEQLHQLRYLLLEAALPPDTAPVRHQLLLRVAEALLDGSTPAAAAPLLVGWLQEGLRRAEGGAQEAGQAQGRLSDQDRARLVPMVCGGVAEPPGGGRPVLRGEDGAALLRSLLRPEALLDEGRLDQFASTLKLVLDTCASASLSAEAAEALLSVFDASRLAVLACERAAAPDAPPGGPAGVQSLLSLAHAALGQPGGEACGLSLLEGVLALQPAAYFAATLQLALAHNGVGAGQRLLSMLCRVPTDMLSAAVVGDAFIQLAEALDGGTLKPPFLPHDLMGRLFRTPHALQSMRALVERGQQAAAAEAAAAEAAGVGAPDGQGELWTVRVGASHASLQMTGEGHEPSGSSAAQAQGSTPAGGQAGAAEGAAAEGPGPGDTAAGGAAQGLLLLPLQASREPLAALLQRLVGAVLSCLLRRAGSALDATTVSEELSALLEALLLPAAEQGAWMLQWLWQCLYQGLLRDFLRDLRPVDAGSAQLAVGAFQSYWASLPWPQASFHADSPAALATLRVHLVAAAGDGAAATLLGRLDFTPVLAKAAPPARTTPQEGPQVYSLADEEEEEEEEEDLLRAGPGGAGAWAAELGLLALHACVLLPAADQPAWLRQLLVGMRAHTPETPGGGVDDEADVQALMQRSALSVTMSQLLAAAGEHQPLLPPLLAGADWQRLAAAVHAEEATAGGAVPWLLLPALLAGDSLTGGDLGSRLVHAATLLAKGAALTGAPQAAETAAGAAGSLLLCTLCQGARHVQRVPPLAAGGDALAAEDAALAAALAESAQLARQEQVVIPEGFPAELLEGTVEGQQLQLLQQQEEHRRQAEVQDAAQRGGVAAGAAGALPAEVAQQVQQEQHGGRQQGEQWAQPQEIVEVQRCWSLSPGQHVALLQQALLPLAAAHASNNAAGAWQQDDCPHGLWAPAAAPPLHEWHAPHLPDLLQAAAAAATAGPHAAEARNEASAAAAAAACVAAVLAPLVRPPVTVLLQDSLASIANSELPLDTEGAVFVAVGPEARGGGDGGADAGVVRSQLLVAVLAACKQPGADVLAACLLRLLYACPELHACAAAVQLSEGLLCFLASPEQDGGPLGQGAAAAAGAEAAIARPGMLPAITATQGLPAGTLLGLAENAARLHAPLTAALAVERLRQGSTVLPKDEWQAQTTRVLHVALQAESGAPHPHDVVALWLAALAWVADPRWRRLASGPHQAALAAWLEALELRVVALQLAQPEDFTPEGSGSAARRLLSGAADRFKAMRQHMPRLGPAQGHADVGEHASAADVPALPPEPAAAGPPFSSDSPPGGSSPGKEAQLGQRLSSGFRSLLSKAGGKPAGAGGAATEAAGDPQHEVQAAGERRKWGDKVRSRLAKMGLGGKGDQPGGEQHLHMAGEEGEGPALPGGMHPAVQGPAGGHAYGGPGLLTVAEEGGSFSAESSPARHGAPGDAGPPGLAAGGAGGVSGDERAVAVRQRLSSGLQAVGRGLSGGLSRVREKLSESQHTGPRPDELAEHDRDVACRIGLAAFAVSAYIKSVLCPSLTPRPGADTSGPPTPTSARPPAEGFPAGPLTATQRHYHRARSSFGSMQLDAEYMRELDRLIEARTELDSLDSLAACPLLQRHPGRYQAFLAEAPQLLSAGTGVEAFQRRLQQLLFPGERQLAALA